MLGDYLKMFKLKPERPKSELRPGCYVALAEPSYGRDVDITKLLSGGFDTAFKNTHLFMDYCSKTVFTDAAKAGRNANSRSLTDNSAYVIGLSCSAEDIKAIVADGQFSKYIVFAKNVRTNEIVNINNKSGSSQHRCISF